MRKDVEAERIWQEATTEEYDNRSIITRAALLESLETGSILNESRLEAGSKLNESNGGELNFVKKCVMKTRWVCDFKP